MVTYIRAYINCPEILSFLNFNIPQCKTGKTRSTITFFVFTQRTNYASASPINRMMSLANEKIDLFMFWYFY